MVDKERMEEMLLEADYWKQMIALGTEINEALDKMNQILPDCVTNPQLILTAQEHLIDSLKPLETMMGIIAGRGRYLKGIINDSNV